MLKFQKEITSNFNIKIFRNSWNKKLGFNRNNKKKRM